MTNGTTFYSFPYREEKVRSDKAKRRSMILLESGVTPNANSKEIVRGIIQDLWETIQVYGEAADIDVSSLLQNLTSTYLTEHRLEDKLTTKMNEMCEMMMSKIEDKLSNVSSPTQNQKPQSMTNTCETASHELVEATVNKISKLEDSSDEEPSGGFKSVTADLVKSDKKRQSRKRQFKGYLDCTDHLILRLSNKGPQDVQFEETETALNVYRIYLQSVSNRLKKYPEDFNLDLRMSTHTSKEILFWVCSKFDDGWCGDSICEEARKLFGKQDSSSKSRRYTVPYEMWSTCSDLEVTNETGKTLAIYSDFAYVVYSEIENFLSTKKDCDSLEDYKMGARYVLNPRYQSFSKGITFSPSKSTPVVYSMYEVFTLATDKFAKLKDCLQMLLASAHYGRMKYISHEFA